MAKTTTIDDRTRSFMERSILVTLRVTRVTTTRAASKDHVETDVDKTMLHLAKSILDSAELRELKAYDHETAGWFRARATDHPMLAGGWYLLSTDFIEDAEAYLDARLAGRQAKIDAFIAVYPAKVEDARKRLGPMFDPSEYPAKSELRAAFTMEWSWMQIETPKGKLSAVSNAVFEREKKKAALYWADAAAKVD